MPTRVQLPKRVQLIETELLSQTSFSMFGTVIQNPAPSLIPSANLTGLPPTAAQANQGTALKYLDVTTMQDLYGAAPSTRSSRAVMNMFVCAPRLLVSSQNPSIEGFFPVQILERHPYTTQTFIPLGISPQEVHQARYLVVVAPSLPTDDDLPTPQASARLPGRSLPDLTKVRAFMADGSQAVTYGAGTWHAPMVVIGKRPIDFIVVQFANMVDIEDCQEVDWETSSEEMISVAVPTIASGRPRTLSRL